MERGSGRRTAGEVRRVGCLSSLLTVVCALALAGCNPDNQGLSAAQPRGATVAFRFPRRIAARPIPEDWWAILMKKRSHVGLRLFHANSLRLIACAAIWPLR